MPIYEYRCGTCSKTFEQLRGMRDADRDVECPECRSPKVERLLSGFAMSGGGSSSSSGGGGCSGGHRGHFS